MGTRYEIHEVEKYYDNNVCDSHGNPVEQRRHLGSFTSSHEVKVGESRIFKKNGKLFERVVISVHSNGYVWEDVESLDVEYSIREIKPDEFVIVDKEAGRLPGGGIKHKFGIINARGETTVPLEYDEIEKLPYPSMYGYKVRKGQCWGVIYGNGDIKIPVKYDSIIYPYNLINKFDNYLAKKGSTYLSFDSEFNAIQQDLSSFKIIAELYDGLFIVDGGKQYSYGLVNKQGEIVLPLDHSELAGFGNGLIIAEMNNTNDFKRYICDKHGKWIVGPFNTIHRLVKERFGLSFTPRIVKTTNIMNLCGKGIYKIGYHNRYLGWLYNLIDENGEILLKQKYHEINIWERTLYATFKTNIGHDDIHDQYDVSQLLEKAGLHDL